MLKIKKLVKQIYSHHYQTIISKNCQFFLNYQDLIHFEYLKPEFEFLKLLD